MDLETTDQIRDTEIELYNMHQRNITVTNEMDTIKKSYVNDIESEWTANKSPDLSNQTKRNAAVDELLTKNNANAILVEEQSILHMDISMLSIDLDYIKRIERQKLSDIDMLPFNSLDRIANSLDKIANK